MKERLDVLLVKRNLAESREKAKAIIMSGNVFVNGNREDKAGTTFDEEKAQIEIKGHTLPYVSRGGLKLEKAIEVFGVDVKGKVCMDIGASTGGFTDCMLQNGASKVYSVDVGYGQLAKALGVEVGERMSTTDIRNAVLNVRASKGMLEDSHRYLTEAMRGTKKSELVAIAHNAQRTQAGNDEPDYNRHSCGSFFMNPILTKEQAAKLPEDAPRFSATLPDGTPGVKTSAAWLIDHAGFHKGYKTSENATAGLSTMHTLALTNRGGASAADIVNLAKTVQDGVERAYDIRLVPEPVVIGMSLM